MRLSIPGLPGVYYDTDARSTALTAAFTLAGRRAPKPQGYGLQLLPYVWSFDVDLREVPPDHAFQYLHPEGARSLEALSRGDLDRTVSRELDRALRFAWAVSEETETAFDGLLGVERTDEGVVVEIDEGALEAASGGDVEGFEGLDGESVDVALEAPGGEPVDVGPAEANEESADVIEIEVEEPDDREDAEEPGDREADVTGTPPFRPDELADDADGAADDGGDASEDDAHDGDGFRPDERDD